MKKIPFRPEFKNLLLSGEKTATSRRRIYAEPGEYFSAFGENFHVNSVELTKVGEVAKLWFKEEGFSSPEAFLEMWAKIHPHKAYDLTQRVFLHRFTKMPRSGT